MRPVPWAITGGLLLVLGIGWAAYFAEVIYPNALNCPRGASCAVLTPLWNQPGMWYGIVTAVTGAILLIVASSMWLSFRRRKPIPLSVPKDNHQG